MTRNEYLSKWRSPAAEAKFRAMEAELWAEKGDWEKAHTLIQDIEDKEAAWIHAYLHRKEGDSWNADYWYRRAGKSRPAIDLQAEWEQIADAFL